METAKKRAWRRREVRGCHIVTPGYITPTPQAQDPRMAAEALTLT